MTLEVIHSVKRKNIVCNIHEKNSEDLHFLIVWSIDQDDCWHEEECYQLDSIELAEECADVVFKMRGLL